VRLARLRRPQCSGQVVTWSCALVLALGTLAWADGGADEREALFTRYAEYQNKQRASGAVALELRGAQQRYVEARATLRQFRAGKTPAELSKLGPQIDALEAELISARKAYEAKAQGELGRRYRQQKAELDATLRSLAAGVGKLLREQDDPKLRRLRAALFVDKGHFSLARRDLRAVLKASPKDAVALTLRGQCHEAVGATPKALADYRAALALEPSDERRIRAAVAAYWLNQFELALELRNAVKARKELPAQLQVDYSWYLKKPLLEAAQKRWARELEERAAEAKRDDLPRVELETSRGKVVLELFEDRAPNTVANFVELVEKGFYEGLPWHRVQPLRLAVTGRPKAGGKDPVGPGYAIEGEARLAGARRHFRGSVGCLIRGPQRRGGSQFYVLLRPDTDLDGQCTVFGRVLSGLEVVAQLKQDDLLKSAKVIRKRKHPYESKKLPLQ
jgi:cyclophilin family peptidyl-prolyl cis-trans isomerase